MESLPRSRLKSYSMGFGIAYMLYFDASAGQAPARFHMLHQLT